MELRPKKVWDFSARNGGAGSDRATFEHAFNHAHNATGTAMNRILQLLAPIGPFVPVSRTGAGDPKSYDITGDLSVDLPRHHFALSVKMPRSGLHGSDLPERRL